jgi:hypothetical protein
MTEIRVWSVGLMILKVENRDRGRKTWEKFSATNPAWTGLGPNQGFRGARQAKKHRSCTTCDILIALGMK